MIYRSKISVYLRFQITVSENGNVHAQICCGFIYAVSLLYEAIPTKAYQFCLISHLQVLQCIA